MIRTIFWSDRTVCIVKFDLSKFPSPLSLCKFLKRKTRDIFEDIEGIHPTYLIIANYKNGRWFKNPNFEKIACIMR